MHHNYYYIMSLFYKRPLNFREYITKEISLCLPYLWKWVQFWTHPGPLLKASAPVTAPGRTWAFQPGRLSADRAQGRPRLRSCSTSRETATHSQVQWPVLWRTGWSPTWTPRFLSREGHPCWTWWDCWLQTGSIPSSRFDLRRRPATFYSQPSFCLLKCFRPELRPMRCASSYTVPVKSQINIMIK